MRISSAEEFDQLMDQPNSTFAVVEATEDVWLSIIRDYPHLRKAAAGNKTISESVVRELYNCGDDEVLDRLASKRRTPSDLLAKLAQHPNERIRRSVACNAKCPGEVLELLGCDKVIEIQNHALRRLQTMGA